MSVVSTGKCILLLHLAAGCHSFRRLKKYFLFGSICELTAYPPPKRILWSYGRSYVGRGIAALRIRWSKVDCESNISDCLRHCFALRAAVLERCGGDKGYSPLSGLQLWATSEVSPCTLAASSCIAVVEYLAYFIHTWDSISKVCLMHHIGLYTHKRIWMDVLLYWSKMWSSAIEFRKK